MDTYLEDMVIYSDRIDNHVKYIRVVFVTVRREKPSLSPKEMVFFQSDLKGLENISIKMDPWKVDAIEKWETPTSCRGPTE